MKPCEPGGPFFPIGPGRPGCPFHQINRFLKVTKTSIQTILLEFYLLFQIHRVDLMMIKVVILFLMISKYNIDLALQRGPIDLKF